MKKYHKLPNTVKASSINTSINYAKDCGDIKTAVTYLKSAYKLLDRPFDPELEDQFNSACLADLQMIIEILSNIMM